MYNNIPENKHVLHEKSQHSFMKSSASTTSRISVCSELYGWQFPTINHKQKQQIIDSNWGKYALDFGLWDDNKSPVVQIRPSKILFDNKECCGFLSDRLIGIGSSFLTRLPENGPYILSKYIMRKANLTNINILQYHRYLQYIDIADNNIRCLSSLSNLPYLMYLNASHNKIKHLLNFIPPWYLTYVNLSYNHLTTIGDLKNCWSIIKLNLSHNLIENISGLENLKYLQYLDLSYNLIDCIKNIDGLNIQELNLTGNCITSFKSAVPDRGINILPNLRTIKLGYNRLSTLEFFKDTSSLCFIDLKYNKITDLLEVMNLSGPIHKVNLKGNNCTKWPNYRNVLISFMPNIKFIDNVEVSATEKVASTILFASPLDLITACNVAKLTLLEQLNINKIEPHVQPYDKIGPPLIILTGPSAVKKLALALHVTQTINNKVKYCRWHSTKEKYENDDERNGYILVSREKFNNMARCGEFLAILDLLGHSYGFHTHQITQLISEDKIGLTQMNLHASIEISKRYSNVKTILVLTNSVDLHSTWIKEKFHIYTWIKDSVENLLAVKIGKHTNDMEIETPSYILKFIEGILDEIMEDLELPSYSIYVRPQGTGATTTDIILESRIMLPKVKIKRSEIPEKKKQIRFQEEENENNIMKFINQCEEKSKTELKIILDESSNIIIEDEKSKREIYRMKMLYRRSMLKRNVINNFNNDNFSESTSSDELIETTRATGKVEALKNIYTELVIKSRDLYLSYHESHPGFFTTVLFTDDFEKAFNLLIDIIHESYISQTYRKPIFLPEIDNFKQTEIPIALANIVNEIRENLSISELQRKMILRTPAERLQQCLSNSHIRNDSVY